MDFKVAMEMIGVIRNESQNLANKLKDEDQDYAYDQWMFTAEPFINDMCLMVLVGVWHQVERELVFLAARVNVGPTVHHKEFWKGVANQRKEKRLEEKPETKLNLGSFAEWTTSMETLRLLANCVKHEPMQEPGKKLLKHLNLPLKPERCIAYAPLPGSKSFQHGLAESVNLTPDADYCTIAETFVELADQFLRNVRAKTSLAQVTGAVSLVEFVG